jgi:hypothetical protein
MFVSAFLVMCGIACGMPLLFISNRLCRKYLPDSTHNDYNRRSIELMEERNRLDSLKVEALQELALDDGRI